VTQTPSGLLRTRHWPIDQSREGKNAGWQFSLPLENRLITFLITNCALEAAERALRKNLECVFLSKTKRWVPKTT